MKRSLVSSQSPCPAAAFNSPGGLPQWRKLVFLASPSWQQHTYVPHTPRKTALCVPCWAAKARRRPKKQRGKKRGWPGPLHSCRYRATIETLRVPSFKDSEPLHTACFKGLAEALLKSISVHRCSWLLCLAIIRSADLLPALWVLGVVAILNVSIAARCMILFWQPLSGVIVNILWSFLVKCLKPGCQVLVKLEDLAARTCRSQSMPLPCDSSIGILWQCLLKFEHCG